MDNFLDTDIKFYEVYIGTVIADDKKKQGGISSNISKIIPIKYINETGNLNLNIVKQNKYFNINHPIATVRDNPIFEFPSNIPFKRIKDMIVSDQIPFNNLLNNEEIPNEVIIENIPKYSDSNNITDIIECQYKKQNNSPYQRATQLHLIRGDIYLFTSQ